jgi:hypothetical protein
MPVTVDDVDKVFRFASIFYHSPLKFHEVLGFRLMMLGVNRYGLLRVPLEATLGLPATKSMDVVVRRELWKLQLPEDRTYSILVEAYYALEGCNDLDFCLRSEATLQPLWYRVEAVIEGDIEGGEEVGEVEAEEES